MSKIGWALHCGKGVVIGIILIEIGNYIANYGLGLIFRGEGRYTQFMGSDKDFIGITLSLIGWFIVITYILYFLAGLLPAPTNARYNNTKKYDEDEIEEIIEDKIKDYQDSGKTLYYDRYGNCTGYSMTDGDCTYHYDKYGKLIKRSYKY